MQDSFGTWLRGPKFSGQDGFDGGSEVNQELVEKVLDGTEEVAGADALFDLWVVLEVLE